MARSRWMAFAATLVVVLVPMGPAFAQDYPTKPIRLVVAYPPGGAVDQVARILDQVLGRTARDYFKLAT